MSQTLFVEGMPGSGKSTSAAKLQVSLAAQGVGVAAFQEMAAAHPLHVGELDEMGAAMARVHEKFQPSEFAELALARCRSFRAEADVTIFESFPIQSYLRVLMQMGAEPSEIWSFWDELQEAFNDANPALIYFREPTPGANFREVAASRGREWTEYIVASMEQTPYASSRGLKGFEGIAKLFRDYGELSVSAVERWRFPKLELPATPESFEDRDQSVLRFALR